MERFFTWVTFHPYWVLFFVLVSTAFFAYGLTGLKADAKVENMMPEGNETVEVAERITDIFEINENVVIALVNPDPGGIYNDHTLGLVEKITKGLEDIKGIDSDQISSLFTVSNIVGQEGGFDVVPLCEFLPETDEEKQRLESNVNSNALLHGTLVSKDGAGTLIYAGLKPNAEKARVYFDVLDMMGKMDFSREKFYVAGAPVVEGVIGVHVGNDMGKMMPLVSVVIVLMLLLIFKSLRGVVLPLLVVMLSVIWAMGLMAFFDIPIYPISTIVPIVIMAIGVADGIHIITRYYEGTKAHPERTSAVITINTMKEMWSPVVMTSLTTTVGFLSLLTSSMRPIFYTGVFTAFGVMAAMVFSLTLIPALLSMMRVPVLTKPKKWWIRADGIFERIGFAVFHLRWAVVIFALLIVLASLGGLWVINVDSDPMANFNQSDPIPISTKIINKMFSGAMVVYTTVKSDEQRRFLDPETLRAIDRYQEEVKQIPEVGAVTGLVDFLKMMHRAMNDDDPDSFTVPPSRNLVGAYLMLYSGDNINHYINYGRDYTNIQVRVMTTSTKTLEKVIREMEALCDEHLRTLPGVEVKIGGVGPVLVDMINIIVNGQVYSILLSILGVFLITAIMFRSFVAGLFNILPISLATAMNFGIMGIFKIPLEPATAITSCIGIGVGIDYAIHFIAKFRYTRQKQQTGQKLMETAMATAGKAIFFNAVVVIGGFLVLLASQFPPSRHMGLMISLNMFNSFAAAVTILPVLLVLTDPKFCRKDRNNKPGKTQNDE